MTHVLHLIDDATLGGVTRMIAHLTAPPGADDGLTHTLHEVSKRSWSAPAFRADVIVSHLTPTWRLLPFLTGLRALNPTTPLIHVEHSYSEEFLRWNVSAERRFLAMLRTSHAVFDRVVAVSRAQAAWLAQSEVAPARKIRVISPSVELEPFLQIAPPSASAPPRIAGLLGRLAPQKGFDHALMGFQRAAVAGAELHIFGAGADEPMLRRIAHGAANIVFHGVAPDPAAALASCDLIVVPSLWEPFGLVALEARAASRPVLCAPVDGLLDQIAEGAIAAPRSADGAVAWEAALRTALTTTACAAGLAAARAAAAAHAQRFTSAWRSLLRATDAARRATQAVA